MDVDRQDSAATPDEPQTPPFPARADDPATYDARLDAWEAEMDRLAREPGWLKWYREQHPVTPVPAPPSRRTIARRRTLALARRQVSLLRLHPRLLGGAIAEALVRSGELAELVSYYTQRGAKRNGRGARS